MDEAEVGQKQVSAPVVGGWARLDGDVVGGAGVQVVEWGWLQGHQGLEGSRRSWGGHPRTPQAGALQRRAPERSRRTRMDPGLQEGLTLEK